MSVQNSRQKQAAANVAVDFVKDGMVVGLGTGSTANYFIEALAKRVKEENLKISTVASSFVSGVMASEKGLYPLPMEHVAKLDFYCDGADEITPDKNLIKGRGAAMLREKILATSCDEFCVIADETKLVDQLGKSAPIPLEVFPPAHASVMKKLQSLDCEAKLRMAGGKDGPVITDQGNFVVDLKFQSGFNLSSLSKKLDSIPGIIAHGLFISLAGRIIIADQSGTKIMT